VPRLVLGAELLSLWRNVVHIEAAAVDAAVALRADDLPSWVPCAACTPFKSFRRVFKLRDCNSVGRQLAVAETMCKARMVHMDAGIQAPAIRTGSYGLGVRQQSYFV
jgi:hypothetical protein